LLPALEHLLSHQRQVDGEGTDLQDRRKALGLPNVGEAASDLSTDPTVDSVREVGEVDDRPSLHFAVENDGEVTGERFSATPAYRSMRGPLAPPGDCASNPAEGDPPLFGEAEGDVRTTEFIDFLIGANDLGAI
jgi:hypothetical protein